MRLTILGRSPPRPIRARRAPAISSREAAPGCWSTSVPAWSPSSLRRHHPDELDAVVVSHMHADHMLDLVTLRYVYPWRERPGDQRLRVFLPPGSADQMLDLARGVGSAKHFEACFRLAEHDGAAALAFDGMKLTPVQTQHYIPCWGFRAEADGRRLAYTADTAPCGGLTDLATAPTCCSARPRCDRWTRTAPPEPRGHLTPAEAGDAAREGGSRRLLLTHMPVNGDGSWARTAQPRPSSPRSRSPSRRRPTRSEASAGPARSNGRRPRSRRPRPAPGRPPPRQRRRAEQCARPGTAPPITSAAPKTKTSTSPIITSAIFAAVSMNQPSEWPWRARRATGRRVPRRRRGRCRSRSRRTARRSQPLAAHEPDEQPRCQQRRQRPDTDEPHQQQRRGATREPLDQLASIGLETSVGPSSRGCSSLTAPMRRTPARGPRAGPRRSRSQPTAAPAPRDGKSRVGDRCVGHRCRQLDERLDRAERLGESEQAGGTDEAAGALLVPQLDRQHRAGQAHLPLDELRGRMGRQPRVVHASTSGRSHSQRPSTSAFADARSMRSASVRRPRMTRKQSNGLGTAPAAFWWNRSRSASSSERVAMRPPTTSECPPRYFVAECSTRSAPSSSGRWRYGVANVLSTTVMAPTTAARRATALMSMTFMSGFDGVSIQTTFGGRST